MLLQQVVAYGTSHCMDHVLRTVRTRVEEHWHMTKQFVSYIRLRCVYGISMMTHVLCAVKRPA